MLGREMEAAFGAEHPVEYDPVASDYWQIRWLIHRLSATEISPAQAAAAARNAKHPPLFIDEDHPPREGDRGEVPFQLVVDWICHREVTAARKAYAERLRTMGVTEPLYMPEAWYEGYLKLMHAIRNGTVKVRLVPHDLDCRVADCPEIVDVFLANDGGAFFWHCDEKRSSETSKIDIGILRSDFRELWPARSRSEQQEKATAFAESEATRRLIQIMRAAPDTPTSKAELRRRPAFSGLGKNAFDRVYQKAARDAHTPAWLRPGRRPARSQGTPNIKGR